MIEKWNQLRTGIPTHYNDCKKIKAKMNKNLGQRSCLKMIKDQFYDIDTLKEKYDYKQKLNGMKL